MNPIMYYVLIYHCKDNLYVIPQNISTYSTDTYLQISLYCTFFFVYDKIRYFISIKFSIVCALLIFAKCSSK